MTNLDSLFRDRADDLRAGVEAATNVENVVDTIRAGIDAIERGYIDTLSVSQARIATPAFEAVRCLLDAFRSVSTVKVEPNRDTHPESPDLPRRARLNRVVDKIRGTPAGSEKTPPPGASGQLVPEPTVVRIETEALLESLARAIESIGRAVSEAPSAATPPRADVLTLESHGPLLEFFHNLAADALDGDGGAVLKRSRQVPRVLGRLGVRVEVFQPDDPAARGAFEFEPGLDPEQRDYITLAPAFIKDGVVLARGRVVEPRTAGPVRPAEEEIDHGH